MTQAMTNQNEMTNEFGPHLMLDCRGCDPAKIGDVQAVFNFLYELPNRIGMTKITQPYVFPYSGLVPEDKGVTGMVIIAESHLTFHSFTEKDYFFFDLFSCKPFDTDLVTQYVVDYFGVSSYERHEKSRGLDFPRSEFEPVRSPDPVIEPVTLAAAGSTGAKKRVKVAVTP